MCSEFDLFALISVVKSVCEKFPHKVRGQKLCVTPYYIITDESKTVWDESKHTVKIPEALVITELDSHLHNFVISSTNIIEKVNSRFDEKSVHAKVEVHLEDQLKIECMLDKKTPNVRTIVRDWEKMVKEIWNSFLEDDLHQIEVEVSTDVWDPLTKVVDNTMQVHDSSRIKVQTLHGEYKLVFVGERQIVEEVHEKIGKERERIDAEVRRRNSITAETKAYPSGQIKLLKRMGVIDTIKGIADDFDAVPDIEKGEIEFKGVPTDIMEGRLEVEKNINLFETWVFSDNLSTYQMKLLETSTVQEELKSELHSNGLTIEMEIQDGKIKVFASNADQRQVADDVIKQMVAEDDIKLDDTSVNVLTTPDWKDELEDIQCTYYEKVLISPSGSGKIIVTATQDLHHDVMDRLEKFIKEHSIYNDIVDIPEEGQMKFIARHCYKELDNMERDLSSEFVKLTLQDMKITMEGTKSGIRQAKDMINDKLLAIEFKVHEERKPGITEIVTPESVTNIEDDTKTVIMFSGPQGATRRRSPSPVNRGPFTMEPPGRSEASQPLRRGITSFLAF